MTNFEKYKQQMIEQNIKKIQEMDINQVTQEIFALCNGELDKPEPCCDYCEQLAVFPHCDGKCTINIKQFLMKEVANDE